MSSVSASPTEENERPLVKFGWLLQRPELYNFKEDWTGLTDPIERRRLQNRLNQRARRTKTRKQLQGAREGRAASDSSGGDGKSPHAHGPSVPSTCINSTPRVQALMNWFAEQAHASFVQGTPALAHLPLLVQYNVQCGFLRNAEMLRVVEEYQNYDGISYFSRHGSGLDHVTSNWPSEWPPNLHPTPLQLSVEHHPWIDLFPWPVMRDNMIQALKYPEIFDEDELCQDTSDYSVAGRHPMLVIWGPAWDPRSWEMTVPFLTKWGWLFSGCGSVLEATNYWRLRRGESVISKSEFADMVRRSMPKQLLDSQCRKAGDA